MKQKAALIVVLLLGAGAIYFAQRKKPEVRVGPDAILNFVADTQREVTRLPAGATRLTDGQEIEIGRELVKQYGYYEDRDHDTTDVKLARAYVEKVGRALSTRAKRKLPYSFHYVPDRNLVNAFALPGGAVYIGAGLIDLMDSEDELASVLGHEIEHIDQYHAAERVQVEATTRHLGAIGALVNLPIEVFQAGYTKEQELEADREGTRLSVLSGYSPVGAIRMFEAFDRVFREAAARKAGSPQEEVAQVAIETLGGYFRSHPPSAERAQAVRDLMLTEQWPATAEKPLEIEYMMFARRAEDALQSRKYDQAKGLAQRALGDHPRYDRALRVIGAADFATADFRGAADAYRALAESHQGAGGAYEYVRALGCLPDHRQAAKEFRAWLDEGKVLRDESLYVASAGLELMAGDETEAKKYIAQANANRDREQSPEWLGHLAGWYYWAGRYDQAANLLVQATQLRPGNINFHVDFGWTLLEQRQYASAMAEFTRAGGRSGFDLRSHGANAGEMGMAVAHWLSKEREEAIARYSAMVEENPAWKNDKWVRAQYSATVSKAVAEMGAEVERRKREAAKKPN